MVFSCKEKEDSAAFYMPGEFEKHEAIWFGWDGEDSLTRNVALHIMKAIQNNVQIKIAVDTDSLKSVAKLQITKAGMDTASIEFFTVPGDRYWIRDHGTAFLVNRNNELAAVDFGWSLYGYFDWWKLREPERTDSIDIWKQKTMNGSTSKVDSLMSVITKATYTKSTLVMEGGAIESNGKGVLIQNEQVALQRNPSWTKEEIEAEYKRVMNVKKVIWMKKGLADDDHIYQLHEGKYVTFGTGGHTDEFVRFADAHTIMLAWVDEEEIDQHPLNRITYERMKENLAILEASTDQDGKPFRIIKVPLPRLVESSVVVAVTKTSKEPWKITRKSFLPEEKVNVGDSLIQVAASSYLNFLITNGVIVNATYIFHGTPQAHEEKVKAIFDQVFPDHKKIWIDALPLNRNGGGIHCSTQQEPVK
jgi:agmatine deiminase